MSNPSTNATIVPTNAIPKSHGFFSVGISMLVS